VRRDLIKLEQRGLVHRTHGGGMATIQEKMGHLESGSAHPLQMHLYAAYSLNNLRILPYRPTLFFVIALTR
jgi:hypothetical protein